MIRILLVDDQRVIREGLKALLEPEVDFQVVGSANNGQTAIEQVEALQPDIVLIDIQMPGMDGVTATRIITQRFATTKVLVLSSYDNEAFLADALRAGAKGYLLKDTPASELADAVRYVNKGYAQIGPGLFDKIRIDKVVSVAPSGSSFENVDDVNAAPSGSSFENVDLSATNSVVPNQVKPTTVLTPLDMEVARALKNFNPQFLPEVVRLTVELGAVARVLAQVDRELKHDLTNLPVLYLAGALSARGDEENKTLALFYLRLGFKEGIKQGLCCEDLLLFYQEGVLLEPEEAFTWLTQVDGLWDNEAGLSFLTQEAVRVFGSDSTHYRTLLTLKQVRAMRTLSEGYAALGSMLKALDLERFCQLLEV